VAGFCTHWPGRAAAQDQAEATLAALSSSTCVTFACPAVARLRRAPVAASLAGVRALVTGSSGFVGGALGAFLRARGWEVAGVSRTPPRPGACDRFVACDLSQGPPDGVGPVDAIVHAAALAAPWGSPAAYRAANVDALLHMLAFAAGAKPRRFVFVSSTAVAYAFRDQEAIGEDTPWPQRPINLYAASKRAGEALVRGSGLPWTIVRPRAVFGPGDTVVFPRILHAAARGMLPRLTRTDGVRPHANLLYIDNLCWFIARVLERDAPGVFDLADDPPVDTWALLDDVLARLGLPPPRRRVPVRAALAAAGAYEAAWRLAKGWAEPPVTRFGVASLAFSKTFDLARAHAALGRPPVSLAQGLDAFVAWRGAQGAAA
jgi:2-alkyl-3-oxoalkanoate reductase